MAILHHSVCLTDFNDAAMCRNVKYTSHERTKAILYVIILIFSAIVSSACWAMGRWQKVLFGKL